MLLLLAPIFVSECRKVFTKLSSRVIWQIANSVLNKGKFAMPPLINESELLFSPSDKTKVVLKPFLRTHILMTQVSV